MGTKLTMVPKRKGDFSNKKIIKIKLLVQKLPRNARISNRKIREKSLRKYLKKSLRGLLKNLLYL